MMFVLTRNQESVKKGKMIAGRKSVNDNFLKISVTRHAIVSDFLFACYFLPSAIHAFLFRAINQAKKRNLGWV